MTLKEQMIHDAKGWAHHAYLRSCTSCADVFCNSFTVEDALAMCSFLLAIAEEL